MLAQETGRLHNDRVQSTVEELPNDLEEVKRIAGERLIALREQENRVRALEEHVALLKKELFGRKSEKLPPEDELQARLFNEAEAHAEPAEAVSVEVKPHTRNKKAGRRPLPEDLERIDIIHDLRDDEKTCACGAALSHIGEDTTEELDIIPQRVVVNRHIRHKYACRSCEGTADESKPAVHTAPHPRLLPGSVASPGLLAHILVSKFCDALPFYRQETIFRRIGVDIARLSMCNWTVAVADKLSVLRDLLREEVCSGPYVGIDETPVQVLKEPGRRAAQKSYMWVMHGGDPDHPIVSFEYRVSREGGFLKERLRNFSGTVMSDGFTGYEHLKTIEGISLAACWAHVRRGFFKAHELSRTSPGPLHVLEELKKLYRIEKELHDVGPPKRKKRRRTEAIPILSDLKVFLDTESLAVVPSGQYGRAIAYALNLWERLLVYAESGVVPIDNNGSENAIRPYVVGRKNWLFFDTQHGAHAGTLIYSLIETAKANGLEPYWYLRYLFDVFPGTRPTTEVLRELLPHRVTTATLEAHFGSRRWK